MKAESPNPEDLVLVAVMNNPRDLEIARVLGWYRIPLRHAPKVIGVDYLAFYQTGGFGEEKWRIQWCARVLGHELTTRAELFRDDPNHARAGEEYYKIQLGPLKSLPRPVMAGKWRRVTFLYTTGAYLMEADTVNDLVVAEDERLYLWRALRERAQCGAEDPSTEMPEMDIDDAVLAALLGIKRESL